MSTTIATSHRRLSAAHIPLGIWTIATLTLTEAMRRKFWLAGLLACFFISLLALFPFHINPMREHLLGPDFDLFVGASLANTGSKIAEFFCFLCAVTIGAGSISTELERGTLAVILPKPLPRWAIYTGKWLGINLFLIPMMFILICLVQWSVWMHVHYTEPNLWRALPVLYLYPLLFSTLTLCFSSFAGSLLSTVMPLIMVAAAWSELLLKITGYRMDIESLKVASRWVVYFVPLNPLSRLHDLAENFAVLKEYDLSFLNSFGPQDPPAGPRDVAWVLGYILLTWAIGLIVFQRRDV